MKKNELLKELGFSNEYLRLMEEDGFNHISEAIGCDRR